MVSLNQFYTFREPTSSRELESLLRIRYEGYSESRCAGLLDDNKHGLDMDPYDLKAIHLGLFENGRRPRPVGYLRIITDQETSSAPAIRSIAAKYPGLTEKIEEPVAHTFPLMHYCDVAGHITDFYQQARQAGEKVVELSRFVFDPGIRSMGFTKFFTEATIISTLYAYGIKYNLLACTVRHGVYYRRFGFEPLRRDIQYKYDEFDASVLLCSREVIQEELRQKGAGMAEAYQQLGDLHYYPALRKAEVPKPLVKAIQPAFRQAVSA